MAPPTAQLSSRDKLLTVKEFAYQADVAAFTVYRWIWHGKLPGVVKYGRTIRIHRAVALAWRKQARPTPVQ